MDYTEFNLEHGQEILAYLQTHGCNPHSTDGIQYSALCPFHDDHKPSFSLKVTDGVWRCHTCNVDGTIWVFREFLRQRGELSLSKSSLPKSERQRLRRVQHKALEKPMIDANDAEVRACHWRIVQYAHEYLLSHGDVLAMLTQPCKTKWETTSYDRKRQERSAETHEYVSPCFTVHTIKQFVIGFLPGSNRELIAVLKKEFSREVIIATGLVIPHGNHGLIPVFAGRIVFPYLKDGRSQYAIGRITPQTPKNATLSKYVKQRLYTMTHKLPLRNPPLYNADVLATASIVLLTEGVTDTIKAMEAGVTAVAAVGLYIAGYCSTFTEMLKGKVVIPCFDNEENGCGSHAMETLCGKLRADGVDVRPLQLPRDTGISKVDVCSFISEKGSEAFHALLHDQTQIVLPPIGISNEEQEYEEAMQFARREYGYIG